MSALHILEVTLYSLLNFLPYLALAFFPFAQKCRFSKPVTTGIVLAATALQSFFFVWTDYYTQSAGAVLSLIVFAAFLLLYIFIVKEEALAREGVDADQVIRQARQVADGYLRGSRIVYYSKPRAEYVTNRGPLDEDAIRQYFKGVCEAASGCLLEVAQREVGTLYGDYNRGRRYVQLARESIEKYWKP